MTSFKQYLRLIVIFLLLLLALLFWHGVSGFNQFKQFHQKLSERSVTSTAREIQALIQSTKRTVNLFAKQEKVAISKLLQADTSRETKDIIATKVRQFFPNHLTFSLANTHGELQYNHNNELIGNTCRIELLDYAKNDFIESPMIIHSGPGYSDHFDVLSPIISNDGKKIGVFFISFRLETLRRILAHGEIVNHNLLLLNSNKPNKVELRATPEYLKISSATPENLQKNIAYSLRIEKSLWNLVDIPDQSLFQNELLRLLVQAITIFFAFLLISGLMLWVLRKEDLKNDKTRGFLSALQNERRRIAMDMHDLVLSELSHISREANQLGMDPGSKEKRTLLTNNIKEVMGSIRSIINDLHPHILDNLGLESALRDRLQKHLLKNDSLKWSLVVEDNLDPLLNNEQRFNLYQIILELINNILKHSECTCFYILIESDQNIMKLVVEDNGKGFNSYQSHKGLGLHDIETRCRLLKAQMHWDKPEEGSGSRFTLTIKLHTI